MTIPRETLKLLLGLHDVYSETPSCIPILSTSRKKHRHLFPLDRAKKDGGGAYIHAAVKFLINRVLGTIYIPSARRDSDEDGARKSCQRRARVRARDMIERRRRALERATTVRGASRMFSGKQLLSESCVESGEGFSAKGFRDRAMTDF